MTIGRIERVPLREVWKHEAHDFTKWLKDNPDVLSDLLDLSLINIEREQPAGAFSVDLVAEDDAGDTVIIENQLGKSDHDHLGKLITYTAALGAKTAIWVVGDARPEHVAAVSWLNETGGVSAYLVKVEAVRISSSPPAPLLTLIVGPSEEGLQVGETKKVIAERHQLRKRFWTQLLDKAKAHTSLHSAISPGDAHWLGASVGGLAFNYVVWQHEAAVEVYIDRGKDSGDASKRVFDALEREKESIESVFGEPLMWERLDDRRASRIRKVVKVAGIREEERWGELQDELVDAMVLLEKAFAPHLGKVKGL
ncbi:MAG: DUF4268 domain-containing protein [Polyangiaceae bacterium]